MLSLDAGTTIPIARRRGPRACGPCVATVLVLVGMAGCNDPFAPASFLEGLRPLAVRATPPEVPPSGHTRLELLVHPEDRADPARLASTRVRWWRCGEAPGMDGAPVAQACLSQAPESLAALVPLGESSIDDRGIAILEFDLPADPVARLGLPDATGGVYVPIRIDVVPGGQDATAPPRTTIYRLRVQTWPGLPVNQNPLLDRLLVAHDPLAPPTTAAPPAVEPIEDGWTLPPGGAVLRALLQDGAEENYRVPLAPGMRTEGTDRTETVDIEWLSTAGHLGTERTGFLEPNTRLSLDAASGLAPGERIDVYAIARDERGGCDWIHRVLRAP